MIEKLIFFITVVILKSVVTLSSKNEIARVSLSLLIKLKQLLI